MKQAILIITELVSGPELSAALAAALKSIPDSEVEAVPSRKAALVALRHREYAVVILDSAIAESDPEGADQLWRRAGLAVPLEFNFAITGSARLAREVRSALSRRSREELLAMRAASEALESELRSTITGLLLHSQLALSDPSVSPGVAEKLRTILDLADSLRQRLKASSEPPVTPDG